MRSMLFAVALLGFVAAILINTAYAISLWGAIGGCLGIIAFPIMLLVVPIALIVSGIIPLYWVLVPVSAVLFSLGQQSVEPSS